MPPPCDGKSTDLTAVNGINMSMDSPSMLVSLLHISKNFPLDLILPEKETTIRPIF